MQLSIPPLNTAFSKRINNNSNTQKTNQYRKLAPLKQDSVSFKGLQRVLSAEDLLKQLYNRYGCANQQKALKHCLTETITAHNNKGLNTNAGKYSKFFPLPFGEEYGIKIAFPLEKNITNSLNTAFIKSNDLFPEHNFGQAVINNDYGTSFVKRVIGEPNSIKNWTAYIAKPALITKAHADEYLQKLLKLSAFPQEAITDFTKKIKIIADKDADLLDLMNPNNVMVDFKRKVLTPIDLDNEKGGLPFRNPLQEIYDTLIDSELSDTFLQHMTSADRNLAKETRNNIFNKVLTAVREIF